MDRNKKLHGLIFNLHLGCESRPPFPRSQPPQSTAGKRPNGPALLYLRYFGWVYLCSCRSQGNVKVGWLA